jgi:hypothetical protein
VRSSINIIGYQIGWFACVLGAVYDMLLAGILLSVFIIFWHIYQAARPRIEFITLSLAGVVGLIWESALVNANLISYNYGMVFDDVAPLWIIMLWLLFATTFNVSLKWLKTRLLMATIFSAVGAPLAFYAGYRLGALDFTNMLSALMAQAVGYAILVPLLLRFAQNYDGYSHNIIDDQDPLLAGKQR